MTLKELLKLLTDIKAKGVRTASELAAVKEAVEKLSDDGKEAVADQVAEVEALPEEDADKEAEEAVKALFSKEAKGIKEETKKEIDAMKAELKEYMKETEEARKKQAGVYNPDVQEKRKALSDRLRLTMKAIALKDEKAFADSRAKEMTTDDTGSPYAGYTVDSELSAEIRHLTTEYGVARREFTALPLSKNSYKANELATDVTVYWVDEGSAISSSQVVLGQNELTLKKLATIVTFTNELLEDTEIDFMNFVGSRVAEGFAQAEDEAYFKGDGTSTYGSFTGLLNNSSISATTLAGTTFASMDGDDLMDLIDALPQGAHANAKFYMHRSIMSIIRKLKATDGTYIYQKPAEKGPGTIWGYPVVLVEAMPAIGDTAADTDFVLFGDLRKTAILGYKASGLRAETFDSGTVKDVAGTGTINLITTDRKAMRFVERTGFVTILENACVKLTTATSSS